MDRKKLEEIIREELQNERTGGGLAQMVAGTVDKLVGAWRETKHGVSDYVLDQAGNDLKRGVLSTFALINKKVDRGQYSDVQGQKTIPPGELKTGHLEEMIRNVLAAAIAEEAPPGREDQVKGLKKHIGKDIPKTYTDKKTGEKKESNPYALAWAQHNKTGKPSKEKK